MGQSRERRALLATRSHGPKRRVVVLKSVPEAVARGFESPLLVDADSPGSDDTSPRESRESLPPLLGRESEIPTLPRRRDSKGLPPG